MFIDDLQYADQESLKLFRALTSGCECKSVLIVGAYRDMASVEMSDHFKLFLEQRPPCVPGRRSFQDISVKQLNVNEVNSIIYNTLHLDAGETWEFSELVFKRTAGNCFYVCSFLEDLMAQGLLLKSNGSSNGKWHWDIEKIKSETSASANVADFLQEKVYRLNNEVQNALKLAACMGHFFCVDLLERLINRVAANKSGTGEREFCEIDTKISVSEVLGVAISEGLIEFAASKKRHYKFNHDKIQRCFHDMVGQEERNMIHWELGMLAETAFNETNGGNDELLFLAADQSNRGSDRRFSEGERTHLIELNVFAGKRAVSQCAFNAAAHFLRCASKLLESDEMWASLYDLKLEVWNLLSEYESYAQNFDECKRLCSEILARGELTMP